MTGIIGGVQPGLMGTQLIRFAGPKKLLGSDASTLYAWHSYPYAAYLHGVFLRADEIVEPTSDNDSPTFVFNVYEGYATIKQTSASLNFHAELWGGSFGDDARGGVWWFLPVKSDRKWALFGNGTSSNMPYTPGANFWLGSTTNNLSNAEPWFAGLGLSKQSKGCRVFCDVTQAVGTSKNSYIEGFELLAAVTLFDPGTQEDPQLIAEAQADFNRLIKQGFDQFALPGLVQE